MAESDVSERLAAIERRLDRLEALLGAVQAEALPVPTVATEVDAIGWAPPAAGEPQLSVPAHHQAANPVIAPLGTLEQAIGLRGAAWVGAIVLVIGAGLGIDFAYRQGWFQTVPPAARVGLLVAIAAALIAAGEWVYRKVNVRSAVGLFAAGVAVLFLAAYAGYAFYGLYGRGAAFALMAAATVVGAAVARRGNLVSVAALSIVGGGLAPALLQAGSPEPVGFLTYLLTLQLVAVALAWRGGPKWWALRGLSLAVTAGWVATVVGLPSFNGFTTVAFLVAYAVVFHAERMASADDSDAAGSVLFGALVTAALAAGLLVLSRNATAVPRTAQVLALATAAGALAVICLRLPRATVGLRAVGVGFALQFIGLIALAVPVAVSGPWVVAGWGVLAVGLAVAGRWSATAAYAAPVVWVLAAFDLLLWAEGWTGDGRAGAAWFTLAGQAVPGYAATAGLLAVGGHVVAALTRWYQQLDERAQIANAVDALAAVACVAASILALPPLGATAAVLAYAAVAVVIVPVAVGTAVAVGVAIKWMAADVVLNRPATGSTRPTAALGIAVVAILVGVGWANRRQALAVRRVLRVFTVIVGVGAASVAVDAAFAGRLAEPGLAEQVALSVLWAAAAAAVVAAGFGRRLPDLRYVGLSLFAVTLVKVVAVDLSGVGAGYRILSFLGLGGLLLATSVLYGRLGTPTNTGPSGPVEQENGKTGPKV